MRACIPQGKWPPIAISPNHQRNFQQHGLLQLASLYFFGWQSAIPEAGEHSRIRHLIVEQIIGGHGITASVTQGAYGSDTLVRSGRRVILRYRVDGGPGRTRMSDPYVASQISARLKFALRFRS